MSTNDFRTTVLKPGAPPRARDGEDAFERLSRSERRRNAIVARRHKALDTPLSRVAGDRFFYKNWYWPGGQEKFPLDRELQFVRIYYPYAEGGPLLADEIDDIPEIIERAKKKAGILTGLGFRYAYVTPATTQDEIEIQLRGDDGFSVDR